jgi:hypothetical protein
MAAVPVVCNGSEQKFRPRPRSVRNLGGGERVEHKL